MERSTFIASLHERIRHLVALFAMVAVVTVQASSAWADPFRWAGARIESGALGRMGGKPIRYRLGRYDVDHGRQEVALELAWGRGTGVATSTVWRGIVDGVRKIYRHGNQIVFEVLLTPTGSEVDQIQRRCWQVDRRVPPELTKVRCQQGDSASVLTGVYRSEQAGDHRELAIAQGDNRLALIYSCGWRQGRGTAHSEYVMCAYAARGTAVGLGRYTLQGSALDQGTLRMDRRATGEPLDELVLDPGKALHCEEYTLSPSSPCGGSARFAIDARQPGKRCRVRSAKVPFYRADAPKRRRRAYLVKGDPVDVLDSGSLDGTDHQLALVRFQRDNRVTVGLVELSRLHCEVPELD